MKTRLILAALLGARCSRAAARRPSRRATRRARQEPFTVMLDYFPNADHAGIYAAQAAGLYAKAGLDVKLQPPPDPSAPLKLLRAGRADLAISYEPELLLARDAGAENLVAVGALVQMPLTSLMALPVGGHPLARGPGRQARRHVRHPVPERLPEDDPREGGRRPGVGQGDQRRLQPRPGDALQEGRRDARRVLELRGRRPRSAATASPVILRMEDARRADLQRADPRRAARVAGRRGRLAAAALHHRDGGRAPARARRTRRPASTRC